jgi:hypothetical protein
MPLPSRQHNPELELSFLFDSRCSFLSGKKLTKRGRWQ